MDKYPKYTGHQIFCTTKGKFRDVDIGNLFFMQGDILCVRMNYPAKRQMARNTVIICAEDPGLCGLGMFMESHDGVDIVTDSSVTLRGAHLV